MKTTLHAVVILTLLAATGSVAFAQAPGLELRLESDVTEKLPGVPVPLRLVAVNQTSRALTLPAFIFIHAGMGAEERFLGGFPTGWARVRTDAEMDDASMDDRLSIAPRATIVAHLGVSPNCDRPPFLLAQFLDRPARYTLRAVAAADMNALSNASERGATLAETLQALPDAIVSTPWVLDVRAPQGVDAETWTWLSEVSDGQGWAGLKTPLGKQAEVAAELRQRFPASQYTLCFGATGLLAGNIDAAMELVTRARAVTPRPPMLDWLELRIAGWHAHLCRSAFDGPRNVALAISECQTARTLYSTLATTALNPEVQAKSREGFETTMSEEEIRDFALNLEARELGTFQKVVPMLQCVKESGPRIEARFGYNNPNPFTVSIARGAMNFFTPAPEDRGQPTVFPRGASANAFSVTVEAKKSDPARTIAWTLDGVTVTVSPTTPRCKGK